MSPALLVLPLLHTLSGSVPVETPTPVREPPSTVSRPVRIVLEWAAGNVTLLGLTAAPAFIGAQSSEQAFYAGMIGGAAAASTASPLTVWGTGELLGGDGRLWGSYAGFVAPALLGLVVGSISGNAGTGLFIGALAAPTGAVVGYELSQRPAGVPQTRRKESGKPAGLALRPWVQPNVREGLGAQLGLSGSF